MLNKIIWLHHETVIQNSPGKEENNLILNRKFSWKEKNLFNKRLIKLFLDNLL